MSDSRSFKPMHQWMADHRTAYSCFMPEDIEYLYNELAEAKGWPEWDEVKDDMLNSYHWRRAMSDRMTEVGWSVIADMIPIVMSERGDST